MARRWYHRAPEELAGDDDMGFLPDPLHPSVIHFPIALSLVGVLLDLVSRHRKARILEPGGAALMLFAAAGAVVAVLSGDAAHDEAVVPPVAAALVGRHEALGEIAMWLLIAVAAVRLAMAIRGYFRGVAAWAYLVLAAAVAVVVSYQGHLGGQLVFRHGVGTAPVQRGAPLGNHD
jgi:uncharacterized membrane protein